MKDLKLKLCQLWMNLKLVLIYIVFISTYIYVDIKMLLIQFYNYILYKKGS